MKKIPIPAIVILALVLLANATPTWAQTAGDMLAACKLATGQTPMRASTPRVPFSEEQIAAERAKRGGSLFYTPYEKAMIDANTEAIRRFGADIQQLQEGDYRQLIDSGRCWGAMAVIIDIAALGQYFRTDGSTIESAFRVCVPAATTLGQLAAIFVENVAAHPDQLAQPFTTTMFGLLRARFPCNAGG
jgi:hypothetical protein